MTTVSRIAITCCALALVLLSAPSRRRPSACARSASTSAARDDAAPAVLRQQADGAVDPSVRGSSRGPRVSRNATDYHAYARDAAARRGRHVADRRAAVPHRLGGLGQRRQRRRAGGPTRCTGRRMAGRTAAESDTSPWTISSFAAVDEMIGRFARARFPNLREVVVAGHSAGGQFTIRYAAATRVDGSAGRRSATSREPLLVLYFTHAGASGRRDGDRFSPPRRGARATTRTSTASRGSTRTWRRSVGGALRAQFGARRVVYLLGAKDADPNDSSMDLTCQGDRRASPPARARHGVPQLRRADLRSRRLRAAMKVGRPGRRS